jgi:hypothetical protein
MPETGVRTANGAIRSLGLRRGGAGVVTSYLNRCRPWIENRAQVGMTGGVDSRDEVAEERFDIKRPTCSGLLAPLAPTTVALPWL